MISLPLLQHWLNTALPLTALNTQHSALNTQHSTLSTQHSALITLL
ncbi:hypothetical protein [Nostoc sp. UHCC 0870]